jgi:hypothetical protein
VNPRGFFMRQAQKACPAGISCPLPSLRFREEKKRGHSGCVERYFAPEEHEALGQDEQGEFADLSPATSRPDKVA